MIRELERVVLATPVSEHGLEVGDIGTVALVHAGGKGFEVEFVALDGETITVTTLLDTQVRPIKHREIAHARMVAVH